MLQWFETEKETVLDSQKHIGNGGGGKGLKRVTPIDSSNAFERKHTLTVPMTSQTVLAYVNHVGYLINNYR